MKFREDQLERYSRQIAITNVGKEGQEKLLKAKVLVIGTGGLGSPISIYLASAGVGHIGIADSDVVDISNLQRQIVHCTESIGKVKVESAKERLNAINPDVEITPYNLRVTSSNIMDIIKHYDIVVDASDNFRTKFLVNDACIISKKVLSHGGMFRYDGQTITILPGKSACYRCLFPEPPPPGVVPSAQQAGIFGAVAGVIGTMQANEVLKYILGVGDLLAGKLLVFNALTSSFKQVNVPRDPDCPVCGKNPTITKLIDYENFCPVKGG
ncbi:ThiF family adenylyltransferase [Candidatus Omnitrophota bacterium]